jgi:tight adherence protein B
VLLAGLAGALAVLAAWDALAAAERARLAPALARAIAHTAAAGRGGREPTSPERRRLAALGALAFLGAGWLVLGGLGAVVLASAGPAAAGALLRLRRRRWRLRLGAGVPALARALADAVAGGHSVRGAVAEAAHAGGLSGPVAGELRACAGALALGEPSEAALRALARRAQDPGIDAVVAAVLVQRDAGGDLAGLLRTTASGLEAAGRVRAEARSATAQARATAAIVAGLPLGAAALAELAQPGYLGRLASDPLPGALAAAALVLELLALVAVRRLARVPA